MSNSFNDQLSRMKALMKYGTVNEDTKPISTYSLEHKALAADGKYYGIVRENSKYFVKVAAPGKETIAEAYQYIGGITNKSNYEYNSYTNALKQFELKLGSINEAYDEDRRVVTESLDPFKKEDVIIEGTDKMKNELARQRQIMRNASVIMNEATEIGSTPFKTQPEAEHEHSGDKDYPFTKEGKPEEDRGAIKFGEGNPDKHSSTFGPDSNDVEDYNLDKGDTPKVKDSVASEKPSGGKVVRVNESMEECGIPECGGLFNEEGDEDEFEEPIDSEELGDEEGFGGDEEELGDEEGFDSDEDEFGEEGEFDDEDELGDEDLDDEDYDFEDDEEEDFDDDDEFGEEEDEFGEEGEFGGEDEEPEIELDENIVKHFRKLVRESIQEMMKDKIYAIEPHGSYQSLASSEDEDDEEEEEAMGPAGFGEDDEIGSGEENDMTDDSQSRGKYNPMTDDDPYRDVWRAAGMYAEGEDDDLSNNAEGDDFNPDMMDDFNDFESDETALESLDDYDNENGGKYGPDGLDKVPMTNEAKARKLNSIVESVVNDILNEDELHVFGDHPGYRKKPFTLPQTGDDKFQVNRDWNDDSVYSEEPFGQGKGDSTPFDELVAQITDSVMKQVNEGKKKVK